MVWGVIAAMAVAVSAQVVPGDSYPPRHIEFAGGVTGYPDLVYQTIPGFRPLHLDLYRPAHGSDKTLHPFVVYVHGGGWLSGHTRQSGAFTSWPDVLASLAARGYVVASVEYRLSSEARFPAAEQDVKAAIRWLRSQASTYHIDKTRGLVWGASAGGQLAGLTATSCGVAALEPTGGAAESDCVQGAVTWYGIFDFSAFAAQDSPDSAGAKYLGCQVSKCDPAVVSAASPVTYIKRDTPPMLLIHGRADKTVPMQQSQEMYDRLHAAGVPVQLLLIPDVDHSFIGKTPADTEKASRAALERVFDFIDTTIGARGEEMNVSRGSVAAAVALLAHAGVHAAEDTTAAANDSLAEVVVTGSLITDPNHVASSPIVITSSEDLKQSGSVSIEAALNQLPQFSAAGTAGNGGQGTGGHATVNLHALGSNRNLVLLDGRRLPLADIFGDVDINFIPESILSSVQTITGGASAVYGSDAMSGVVNFITLSNFEGMSTDLQYGNSMKSDYGQFSGSTAFGTKFADNRGHALLSLGYTYRQELDGRQRGFFNLVTPSSFIGQGTFVPAPTNLPNQAAVNTLFGGYGAATPVSNTLNLGFNDDGSLFTQTGAKNYKGPTSNGYAILAGNVRMPVGPQTIIENPLDRKSIFSKVDYQLAEGVTAYGQVLYVDSTVNTSSGYSLTQFGNLTTIPVSNPFIPKDLATLLAARPNPNAPFTWNGRYVGIPVKSWEERYITAQYLGGLEGSLPIKDWTWDVFASYDTTDHNQSNFNAVLKSQVQNLLNAPDGGASLCAGGFDPFGLATSSAISQACQSYLSTTAHSTESLTQTNVQGTVQGALFALPAGDVVAAVLADFRRNTYRYSPDSNLASQNIEAVIASKPSRGAIGVKEFAAQVDVPLLSDLPLIRKLSLGAAFRHSDYTTSGGVNSFEGDLKWSPVESFLVRGGYQRAVRAPNIGELFSADSGSQIAFGTPPAAVGDPCDVRSSARTGANGASVRALCLAQGVPGAVIDSYTFPTTATAGDAHGNPNLQPEAADTYNLGFSWTSHLASPWLSGLSASVDYYNIKINKVISVVPGLTALSKCYNLDGSNAGYSASNEFCALLHRDANGLLQLIDTPYLNLGGLKTDGVDIQSSWSLALADIGLTGTSARVFANSGIGFLRGYSIQTLPGSPFQNYAGTNTIAASYNVSSSFPKWKAVTTIGYGQAGATVSLRWRYQNAMKDVTAVTTPANPGVGVPAYSLVDLLGSYEVNKTWQLRAGITNLGNHGPVLVSSSQFSTDQSVFDVIGRSYYVGVHLTL